MKIREIERLRAFAVLIVVFSHLSEAGFSRWPFLPVGWQGVDLFFVISGFVITNSLFKLLPSDFGKMDFLARIEVSQKGLKIFFYKRFFRIFPMAFLWMTIPLIGSFTFNDSLSFGSPLDLTKECLSILSLQYNFFVSYYGHTNLGHYWSLMVEEHFYLVLPFFLILFSTEKRRFLAVLASIALVALIIRPFAPLHGPDSVALSEMLHVSYRKFDVLFVGVFLALIRKRGWMEFAASWKKWQFWPLEILSMLVIVASPWFLPVQYVVDGGVIGIWSFSAVLVLFASFDKGYILEIPVLKKILEYIGARSYGIYLIHRVAQMALIEIFYRNGVSVATWINLTIFNAFIYCLLLVLSTVALAEICYRLLEKPAIQYGDRIVQSWWQKKGIPREISKAI